MVPLLQGSWQLYTQYLDIHFCTYRLPGYYLQHMGCKQLIFTCRSLPFLFLSYPISFFSFSFSFLLFFVLSNASNNNICYFSVLMYLQSIEQIKYLSCQKSFSSSISDFTNPSICSVPKLSRHCGASTKNTARKFQTWHNLRYRTCIYTQPCKLDVRVIPLRSQTVDTITEGLVCVWGVYIYIYICKE